jgi:GlcNAc-P-P-Und epimerase
MYRILIIGGSGFIGTNAIEFYKKSNIMLNIDIKIPMLESHRPFWKEVDICDYDSFMQAVTVFKPDYIIHLAARTDLDGKSVQDYDSNTTGVKNLMSIVKQLDALKKIIISSSKFIAKNGYTVKSQFDYCPHTVYGESKVITEKNVWNNPPACDWAIIRPTSIWGPHFSIPYKNFFDLIISGLYFHIGKSKCYKTYGYIGNSVYQIDQIMMTETYDLDNKIFYIGDEPPYEINEWADEIALELKIKNKTLPVWFVRVLAKFGDFLSLVNIKFPMQSFRYNNMTKDGTNDLSSTYEVAPEIPFRRAEGVSETIKWIKNQ